MARPCMCLGGLLAIALLGCQRDSTSPDAAATPSQESTAPTSDGLILSPAALTEAFLMGREARIRWRFNGARFVVESWGEPLPETLQTPMLQTVGNVYRIAGRWRLLDDGNRLQVNDLQADGPETKSQADLVVQEGPDETLLVNGTAYRLMDHPHSREILPTERFTARFVSLDAVHLIHVDREGQPESLRLAGIVGPSADHPLGQQALQRVEELLRGTRFHVRVYDPPGSTPRRAHLYTVEHIWFNLALIDEGLAWHDKPNDNEWLFATHEDRARRARLGIWSQSDTNPPWWQQPIH